MVSVFIVRSATPDEVAKQVQLLWFAKLTLTKVAAAGGLGWGWSRTRAQPAPPHPVLR